MKALLVLVIKAYRLLLSPWLGGACRFYPTCSAYALQALEGHGLIKGSFLSMPGTEIELSLLAFQESRFLAFP